MLYLLILFSAAALWVLIEFLNAPSGYEDEEGFHYENQKEKAVVKNIEEKEHKSVFILTS